MDQCCGVILTIKTKKQKNKKTKKQKIYNNVIYFMMNFVQDILLPFL
jgi:hypothetical protein